MNCTREENERHKKKAAYESVKGNPKKGEERDVFILDGVFDLIRITLLVRGEKK